MQHREDASSVTAGTDFAAPCDHLFLLATVDYEGHWDALILATSWVVDGMAKRRLIMENLLPRAESSSRQADQPVNGQTLISARDWFRNLECATVSPPSEEDATA